MFSKKPTDTRQSNGVTEKAKPKVYSYKTGHRLPVLTAEELLTGKKRQWLLEQVRQLSHLEPDYYSAFYEELINSYAEFVQVIPINSTGYMGSLLNESLALAFTSLYHFIHPNQDVTIKKAAPNPLLLFAIFSAGLLVNVSRVMTNQRVILCTEDGNFVEQWSPLNGPISKARSEHYKIRFVHDAYAGVQYSLNVLLARQLLPAQAFDWLQSDELIFCEWLNALRNNQNLDGRVSCALEASKEIRQNEGMLAEFHQEGFGVEQYACPETQDAEAFYQWLTNGIETKQIKVNSVDSGVQIVAGGVFIDQRIFKDFSEVYNSPFPSAVVLTKFCNMMGIVSKGAGDFRYQQYFSVQPEEKSHRAAGGALGLMSATHSSANKQAQMKSGLVVSDSKLIFKNGIIPSVSQYLKSSESIKAELPKLLQVAADLMAGFKSH